jgi:hypothetical protein
LGKLNLGFKIGKLKRSLLVSQTPASKQVRLI